MLKCVTDCYLGSVVAWTIAETLNLLTLSDFIPICKSLETVQMFKVWLNSRLNNKCKNWTLFLAVDLVQRQVFIAAGQYLD